MELTSYASQNKVIQLFIRSSNSVIATASMVVVIQGGSSVMVVNNQRKYLDLGEQAEILFTHNFDSLLITLD